MGRLQTQARKAGEADPLTRISHEATRPLALAMAGGVDGVRDFFGGVFGARALKHENQRLREIARAQELYVETVERLEREIDRLRKAVGLGPVMGRQPIASQVVGYFPTENRITIIGGKDRGFGVGMAVTTGVGMIGVIQSVESRMSQVTLLSSPKPFTIGALVQRNPPPAGLLHGESTEVLILDLERFQAQVEIGDLVVTSGFSETIPRGIPIGRIVHIENNPAFGTRRAQVFPLVQIGAVREVFVLR
ncbi:MAG TPA: rod shape-determining protein MreC [Fimbriimonadaceae bacterium]|nr:rod shape-determining protein MreC [Fimbriimonadaceae bacterium]